MKKTKIFIISGEASGDLLGAKIISEMKKTMELELKGVGGEKLSAQNLTNIFPQSDINIMGFVEVIPAIPKILKRINQTILEIQKFKPDLILTIDSPDFCFRVIKKLKKTGYDKGKIVHLVAPTVWAYRKKRAKKISKLYDLLLVLFPFEPQYFEKHGLKTIFIGHPIIYETPKIAKLDLNEKDPIVTITLGSRYKEIKILTPIYRKALIKLDENGYKFKLAIPTFEKYRNLIEDFAKSIPQNIIITTDEAEKLAYLKISKCAIAKSGTNNFEVAKAKIPFVACYKVNLFTYIMLKIMVRVKYVNLINFLANKEIIPELIQYKCHKNNIYQYISKYLSDKNYANHQLTQQNKYLKLFLNNGQNPSKIAAKSLKNLL